MTLFYRIRALARWLFRRGDIERALDTDLADYIERSAAEKMRAGMSEADARRAARIELGGVEQTKDSVRATLSLAAVENMLADMGYALRTLSRQKTFTAVAVSTLTLGIGANVAIFSLAEQILLRPLPVPEPDRLVNLKDSGEKSVGLMDARVFPQFWPSGSGGPDTLFSYPMFRDLERAQEPFVGLAAHTFFDANLAVREQVPRAIGSLVSGSYFSVLGLRPALGRLLGPEDDRVDGQAESVVLSHAYWQSEFGGDPAVLGRTLTVNDIPLTIVGVAPRGFHGTAVGARSSVFVPITISFSDGASDFEAAASIPNHDRRDSYWVHLFARLQPGTTLEQASSAMDALYRAILTDVDAPSLINVDEQEREAFRTRPLVLEPGARGQTSGEILSPARNGLVLLLAVGSAVLLLCCANIAGLMLVRATTRSGEMAVRASLGATRRRLVSLLFAESLVLTLPAALLSLPTALLVLRGASRVPGLPETAPDASLSTIALLVAIGIAIASALAVGLFPMRRLMRTEPGNALAANGARQTTTKSVARFRAALATAQVALSMALLALTGVLAQSLANVARVDLGVDTDSVVTFSIPPEAGSRQMAPNSLGPLLEALEGVPGASSVSWSYRPVLSPAAMQVMRLRAVDGVDTEGLFLVPQHLVGPSFFRTLGIELLAGRDFDLNDVASMGARGVIVSRQFADHLGLSPDAAIGRSLDLGRRDRTGAIVLDPIVGVVADARLGTVSEEIEPRVFRASLGSTFYIRGEQPERLMSIIRETVARVDSTLMVSDLQTMEQQFRESIATTRFFAGMSTAFAVLATALAAIGLYGVLAYSVAQRSREIGLRFALGAPASRVRAMVLRQVARMAACGVLLGALAAWGLGLAARSLLFGVDAADPLVLAAATVVLAVVTLGAAYIPARRASRVDPMSVLRYE